jgi:OPA family sugar phosphate sensor protein UhpC-like MFS transporter
VSLKIDPTKTEKNSGTNEAQRSNFLSSPLRTLSSLLTPPPPVERIKDPKEIEREYRYWRLRIFYSIYLGYACYYITRKSFTAVMPALGADLSLSNAQLGLISTIFSIVYGVSKFVNGIVSDRSNARYFMAIGLILTGVVNLMFGAASSLLAFALLWGLNGWFQGYGWPPVARLLTNWYSQTERGRWWGISNTSHNIGGGIVPFIVTPALALGIYLQAEQPWRYGFYIPGIISIVMGFFLINRLRDLPPSLGLPPVEEYRNDYPVKKGFEKDADQLSVKELLWTYVISNKYILTLAASYIFVYLIRTGINDWSAKYLIEAHGYEQSTANHAFAYFEAGGAIGTLVAGWASDKIWNGKRGPVNALFMVGSSLAVVGLWTLPTVAPSPWLTGILIAAVGFFIFGPQMLIGVAAAELSHSKATGTATGFIGTFAYLGSAAAGVPLGLVIDNYGWDGFFAVLAIGGAFVSLLLLTLWNVKSRPEILKSTKG